MKKKLIYKSLMVLSGIITLVIMSCSTNVITGQQVKITRDLPAFSGITLAFSGNIIITQGSPQKVEIVAEQKTVDIIETKMSGNNLVLKTRDSNWRDLGKINVYITVPEIEDLTLSGSGDIICEGSLKTNQLTLGLSGSGTIRLQNLKAQSIDAKISGSGNINLAGMSNNQLVMEAFITGSGSIKAEELLVSKATLNITGSGSATVNVADDLTTNITGSGSVLYKGNPLINAHATGSGKTRSIN